MQAIEAKELLERNYTHNGKIDRGQLIEKCEAIAAIRDKYITNRDAPFKDAALMILAENETPREKTKMITNRQHNNAFSRPHVSLKRIAAFWTSSIAYKVNGTSVRSSLSDGELTVRITERSSRAFETGLEIEIFDIRYSTGKDDDVAEYMHNLSLALQDAAELVNHIRENEQAIIEDRIRFRQIERERAEKRRIEREVAEAIEQAELDVRDPRFDNKEFGSEVIRELRNGWDTTDGTPLYIVYKQGATAPQIYAPTRNSRGVLCFECYSWRESSGKFVRPFSRSWSDDSYFVNQKMFRELFRERRLSQRTDSVVMPRFTDDGDLWDVSNFAQQFAPEVSE